MLQNFSPADSLASGTRYDEKRSSTSALDTTPLLWAPQKYEITRHFNLNDTATPFQSVSDLNLPRIDAYLH
ncbi:hypothetical protein V6N13_114041 [Hibiscus sabdariffa]